MEIKEDKIYMINGDSLKSLLNNAINKCQTVGYEKRDIEQVLYILQNEFIETSEV